MDKYDFVYFDVGGTLITPYPSIGWVYANAWKQHGIYANEEDIQRAFMHIWPKYQTEQSAEYASDEANSKDWWRSVVFEVLDIIDVKTNRQAAFESCYSAFADAKAWLVHPDAKATLDSLSLKNIRLGILSNWDLRLPPLLEVLNLRHYFCIEVISCFEGVSKPNPKIFQTAIDKTSSPADRIAFIGDSMNLDLLPGLNAGMDCFLIDRVGKNAHHPRAIDSLMSPFR